MRDRTDNEMGRLRIAALPKPVERIRPRPRPA